MRHKGVDPNGEPLEIPFLHDIGDFAINRPIDIELCFSQRRCSQCGQYFNVGNRHFCILELGLLLVCLLSFGIELLAKQFMEIPRRIAMERRRFLTRALASSSGQELITE